MSGRRLDAEGRIELHAAIWQCLGERLGWAPAAVLDELAQLPVLEQVREKDVLSFSDHAVKLMIVVRLDS